MQVGRQFLSTLLRFKGLSDRSASRSSLAVGLGFRQVPIPGPSYSFPVTSLFLLSQYEGKAIYVMSCHRYCMTEIFVNCQDTVHCTQYKCNKQKRRLPILILHFIGRRNIFGYTNVDNLSLTCAFSQTKDFSCSDSSSDSLDCFQLISRYRLGIKF